MMRGSGVTLLLLLLITGSGDAQTPRSATVRRNFLVTTGYPQGRPGFIVDHIRPLCLGGADALANLQWQTVAEAKIKDVDEKHLCALWRRFLQRWKPVV